MTDTSFTVGQRVKVRGHAHIEPGRTGDVEEVVSLDSAIISTPVYRVKLDIGIQRFYEPHELQHHDDAGRGPSRQTDMVMEVR